MPSSAVFLSRKRFPPDAIAAERSQTQSTSVTCRTNCEDVNSPGSELSSSEE